jgi:hypothetical protein
MTKLIGRAWIPMVMVIVLAIRAFTVSRLRGDFGSYVSAPDSGTADLIVQFKPEGMICEVCWSQPARDAGDRRVTERKVFR